MIKLKPPTSSGLAELVYPHALTAQVKFECLWTMVFALFQFGMIFLCLLQHISEAMVLRRYDLGMDNQRRAYVSIYMCVNTHVDYFVTLTHLYYS